MQNEENESAYIKAQHPLTPQQDNRVFESIPARPAPWKAPENEMRLPKGKTCADCVFFKWCVGLFQCAPTNTVCDFAPSRFRESWNTPVEPSASARLAAEEIARRWIEQDLPFAAEIHSLSLLQLQALAEHVISKHLAPADNDAECQRCGKTGGKVVSFTYGCIATSRWVCPHCLDAADNTTTTKGDR